MKDYSILERVMMVLRVIVSIMSWVVLILVKIVRNLLPIGSKDQPKQAESGTIHG